MRPRPRRSSNAARPSSASGGCAIALSPTASRKPATACSPSHGCRQVSGEAREQRTPSSVCTKSSSGGSRRRPCCRRQKRQRCCSGRCSPLVRSTCARLMVGRRSPQSPSINRLISPPDQILSKCRRSRHQIPTPLATAPSWLGRPSDRADEVILARKEAKSRTSITDLRSTGTRTRKPRVDLEQQLENYRRELAEAREHLAQALERQAATSEVLQVISSSPNQLEPVFRTILVNATRICDANFGNLYLRDEQGFRIAEAHNTPPAFVEDRKRAPYRPSPNNAFGRMERTKSVVHVADLAAEQAYIEGDPGAVTAVELGGVRTNLLAPMLKGGELIGGLAIYRQEVRPFNEKQIELVDNFARQAVIAIENTRLLNELRESLQQQTATADVLKVISRSTFDLDPVFQAMLENATRICGAQLGNLILYENGVFRYVAMYGAPPAFAELRRRDPIIRPRSGALLDRIIKTKKAAHVADIGAENANDSKEIVELAGARSVVLVPMLKEGELIGAIGIYRQEVKPFSDKQIELVTNFASQAVIAIENTRLLNELRESLQQQTATADVLKVISRSTFDLQTVLNA